MLAVVLLAACSGGDDEPQAIEPTAESSAEAPTDTEETAPEEPEDPYAIPDEIDEAYVQSVLDALVPITDEPFDSALATAPHDLPPDDFIRAIQASHSPDQTAALLSSYTTVLADEELAGEQTAERADAPPSAWTLRSIEVERDDCLVIRFDYASGAGGDEGAVGVLLAGYEDRDPHDLNPTPWVIDRTNFAENQTAEQLAERCDAQQEVELDADEGEGAA